MPNSLMKVSLAAVLSVSAWSAWAKEGPGEQFITKAIQGNMAEVSLGQLAEQKGGSDGVKSFGQMLVQDHTAANEKATQAAQSAGAKVPTEPSKAQKATFDKMSKLSGAAFDRQFVTHMVSDHKKDISDYQKEAKRSDGAISEYAQSSLPTLQKHLETAQSLAQQEKASK